MMPAFAPASLLEAAIDIRAGRLDEASAIISRLPSWTASQVYAAEIALAHNDLRTAYQLDQQVANPPEIVTTRIADIRKRLFDQLVADDSIPALREALQLEPAATAARMLLGEELPATTSD